MSHVVVVTAASSNAIEDLNLLSLNGFSGLGVFRTLHLHITSAMTAFYHCTEGIEFRYTGGIHMATCKARRERLQRDWKDTIPEAVWFLALDPRLLPRVWLETHAVIRLGIPTSPATWMILPSMLTPTSNLLTCPQAYEAMKAQVRGLVASGSPFYTKTTIVQLYVHGP